MEKIQKEFSSKEKGSNNKKKAKLKLAKLHRKIANQRKNWHYKIANEITDKYDEVYFENLNINSMKKIWGKKITDLGFYSFLEILEQKCIQKNVKFIKINRFEATSKVCNSCGFKNNNLKINERTWECPSCKIKIDRDLNAAKNIFAVGVSTARGEQVRLEDLIKGR